MEYGFLIVYLIFWAFVVAGYLILNFCYEQFLKNRSRIAKWIFKHVYHEDWRNYK